MTKGGLRKAAAKHALAAALIAAALGTTAQAGETNDVVSALMDAYNRHDVAAMRALWADDIVWYDVKGDEMTASVRSAAAFEAGMRDYFKAFPNVQSKLSGARESGAFLTGVETARWTSKGEKRSQSAPVVYEVRDGKVRRVWYYPSTKGK